MENYKRIWPKKNNFFFRSYLTFRNIKRTVNVPDIVGTSSSVLTLLTEALVAR